MKNLVYAVVVTAVLGGMNYLGLFDKLFAVFGTTEYVKEVKEVVVDNTPDWATDEDAVKAAQDVMRRKELEAELSQLESEIDERQARVDEIEKELGTY